MAIQNPQATADILLLDESKYEAGSREDIEDALHIAAVVLQELRALAKDLRRPVPTRISDESRITALIGFIMRLTAQLKALSRQAADDAADAQLWLSLRSRNSEESQPSGVAKRAKK